LGFYLTWNGYLRKVEALIIAEFYRYLKFNEIIDNGKLSKARIPSNLGLILAYITNIVAVRILSIFLKSA
jgi:hypothetical protein